MAEFIAAAKKNLATGGSEELGEALIHGDAKVATRVAAVGHLILFQDSAKGHTTF